MKTHRIMIDKKSKRKNTRMVHKIKRKKKVKD